MCIARYLASLRTFPLVCVYLFICFSSPGAAKKSSPAESAMPANDTARAPIATQEELSPDPYEKLVADQQKREREWKTQRCAKKAKTVEAICHQTAVTSNDTDAGGEISVINQAEDQADRVNDLKTQLDAKTEECRLLKSQLEISEKTKEANAGALRDQMKVNEDFRKVSAYNFFPISPRL